MTTANGILDASALADLGAALETGLPALRTGQVATQCSFPTTINTVNKQMGGRSVHFTRDVYSPLDPVTVGFPAFYVTLSGDETGVGADATLEASIEYPLNSGNYTRLKFSGIDQGVAANKSILWSDPVALDIPFGVAYGVRFFWQSTAGIIFRQFSIVPSSNIHQLEYAVSGLTNKVMGGSFTVASRQYWYAPCAIFKKTRKASVYIHGDSRSLGVRCSQQDSSGAVGIIETVIDQDVGYINGGVGATTLYESLSKLNLRNELINGCSAIVNASGINDIRNAGRTAAQVIADRTTFANAYPGKIIIGTTLNPDVTTTDNYASTGNQSVQSWETERVNFNNAARVGIVGETACYDSADCFESSRNSGKWAVSRVPDATTGTAQFATDDGLHEVANGVLYAKNQRRFPMGIVKP